MYMVWPEKSMIERRILGADAFLAITWVRHKVGRLPLQSCSFSLLWTKQGAWCLLNKKEQYGGMGGRLQENS